MKNDNSKNTGIDSYGGFNQPPCFDDIVFDGKDIKMIPIERIFNVGFEVEIEHRPIRRHHVDKVKSTYQGFTNPMKAVFIERDIIVVISGKEYRFPANSVVLAGSQHHFTAVCELNQGGHIEPIKEFPIIPAKRRDGRYLSLDNEDDREILFKVSFNEADSQERNCFADSIFMVKKLSDKFLKNNPGKKHGIIDYIYENQYGAKKLTRGTIQQDYRPVVKDTEEACKRFNKDFFRIAQEERWVKQIWNSKLKGYELSNGNKNKSCTITVPVCDYHKLKDDGIWDKITDGDFWVNFAKLPKKDREEIKKLIECKIKVED